MTVNVSLMRIRDLSVDYVASDRIGPGRKGLTAVDSVDLDIPKGSVTGLVGESGSGKTSLGRTIMRLQRSKSGTIEFKGEDITHVQGARLAKFRRQCQMVFQDPFSSLDPRLTVSEAIGEPLAIHKIGEKGRHRDARIRELMHMCGLGPDLYDRKPHELSGGQRQRVGIARALAVEPEFIVLDEPVSALDASVQAQILNLLLDLQQQMGLTYLFIAHDLAVIRHISSHVAVMYLGRIVESAPRDAIFYRPKHPYTRALLSSAPIPDPAKERQARRDRIVLTGDPPNAANPPAGCRFHTRCWLYKQLGEPERCRTVPTVSRRVGPLQNSDCHYASTSDKLSQALPSWMETRTAAESDEVITR